MKKQLLIIFLFLILGAFVQAQKKDHVGFRPTFNKTKTRVGVDSTIVRYYFDTYTCIGDSSKFVLDTAHVYNHNYDPLTRNRMFFANQGHNGHAHYNQLFSFDPSTAYNFGMTSFDEYIYTPREVRYMQALQPFSMLTYYQAPSRGKILKGNLAQRVYEGLNLGLEFDFTYFPSSENTFERLAHFFTNNMSGYVYADYVSKEKRYKANVHYSASRLKIQENGGISDFQGFLNNPLLPSYLSYITNLSDAKNELRDAKFHLNHSWELSPYSKVYDTVDSTKYTLNKRKLNLGKLGHSFEYHRNIFQYSEDAFNHILYDNIYLDSVNTFDSIRSSRLLNTVYWANSDIHAGLGSLGFYYGLSMENVKVKYEDTTTAFTQFLLHAKMSKHLFRGWVLGGELDYTQGGYNNLDTKITGSIIKHFNRDSLDKKRFEGNLSFSLVEAPFMYHLYSSNYFRWNNNFNKQKSLAVHAKYHSKLLYAGFNFYQLSDFVYLNENVTPVQSGAFAVISTELGTRFDFWKLFFDIYGAYQMVSDKSVVAIPDILAMSSFYYKDDFFKGAMNFIGGIEVRYNSAYKGNAYMPALRAFYSQDTYLVGNYVWFDAFINAKIQKAILTLKISHINEGLMGNHFVHVPGYPTRPMEITFGVNWRFYH